MIILVVKLCNAGCEVHFKQHYYLVFHNNCLIVFLVQYLHTDFWMVTLTTPTQTPEQNSLRHRDNIPFIMYTKNLPRKKIEYLHQCLFSSTQETLPKAIQNNNLLGFPGLYEKAVLKYLPDSTATIKGHLNHTRKNVGSTQAQTQKAKKKNSTKHKILTLLKNQKLQHNYSVLLP